MAWMIGIDEAGYGPNLGPLLVGATAWRVPDLASSSQSLDLYQLLSRIVCSVPDNERIAIADSKQLYKPGGGLRHLERGVLSTLATILRRPTECWNELVAQTDADPEKRRGTLPWYANFNSELPFDAEPREIETLATMFDIGCEEADVELAVVRARMVFPEEFNQLTEHYGTKGAALSHVSIGLVRKVIEQIATQHTTAHKASAKIHITCDKHGGRNRYAALLQHHFPEHWIETAAESRAASRYRFGEYEICFRTGGEAELPVALASMTAKYLRELAMRAFNAYWCEQNPTLKPTAGYPMDAKRFKAEIATLQCELGISDGQLWRTR